MPERFYDKWILNWNLQVALSGWKKEPDSKIAMEKMQQLLSSASKNGSVSLMVDREIFENADIEEAFLTRGTANAYGREDGDLLIFDSPRIKSRVAEIAGRGYVFLEKGTQRIGYFRPHHLVAVKSQK